MLSSHFVALRKEVQRVEADNEERSSIPITIRFVSLHASSRYGVLITSRLVNWRQSFGYQSHLPR